MTQTQVRSLYASPAFITQLHDTDGINAELKATILAREQEDTGLSHSNAGGWHSGLDFATWGGPALDRVLATAAELARKLTCDRQGRAVSVEWRTECWANVNQRNQANKRHTHPGCLWSGTYYVDSGHEDRDADNGGLFTFEDPRGVAQALCPGLRHLPPDRACGDDSPLLRPRNGLMVLFPSWMPHAVQPYLGSGTRISIAFNFALGRGPR